ncbi:MAG: competence damage-inducible protein A [Candidatus Heimdallarchaeota archaeon]|nr:competence damage-inducible protein A [Candidatus Heimdallarchaeota archaeon]
MFTAEIICFGNELLIGKTVNTNASWLGKRITTLGGKVTRVSTISDIMSEMIQIVKEVLKRKPDVIITTGGMGTTFDDMSLGAIAAATNQKLIYNDVALGFIKERLEILKDTRKISLELTEERKHMALMPEKAIPLKNRNGSAPGIYLEFEGVKIFAVPGVPREMEAIFDYEIIKLLPLDLNEHYYEKSIIVNYIPESELANTITPIREKYPTIYFKTHPHSSSTSPEGKITVEIHLSTYSTKIDDSYLEEIINELINSIKNMNGIQNKKPIITLGENQ